MVASDPLGARRTHFVGVEEFEVPNIVAHHRSLPLGFGNSVRLIERSRNDLSTGIAINLDVSFRCYRFRW